MLRYKGLADRYQMEDHLLWYDYDIDIEADAFDLAFQSSAKRDIHGQEEYVTEDCPWLFWVKDGAAYGKNLTDRENSGVTVMLATANCTDISAIRAASGTYGYDFGLVVFMLISGNLFYRQLIKGEWYDAELVTEGPEGSYVTVNAFRTWDYRVGVQLIDTNGTMFELFSQFEGIGTRNQEHIDVAINVEKNMPLITYHNGYEKEHLEVGNISAESAMYRTGAPDIVETYNIPTTLIDPETEEEYEDWGIRAVYVFNRQLVKEQVEAQFQCFTLVDNYGITYYPLAAELGEDGHSVTLTFTDFNNAFETCTAKYTPGTVQTMADDYALLRLGTFDADVSVFKVTKPDHALLFLKNGMGHSYAHIGDRALRFQHRLPLQEDLCLLGQRHAWSGDRHLGVGVCICGASLYAELCSALDLRVYFSHRATSFWTVIMASNQSCGLRSPKVSEVILP